MLKEQILHTVKYFDLQNLPLTGFEVWKYLIADYSWLKTNIDSKFNIIEGTSNVAASQGTTLAEVLLELDGLVEQGSLQSSSGYYCLPGKQNLIKQRLLFYIYGLKREKRISRFLPFTKYLPFVRGVALAGSQALGLQKTSSDIDLLIITDEKFMFLPRTILTIYFQIFGVRRHGSKIANRFCLNHYISKIKEVDVEKNLYKAIEYKKLRSEVYFFSTKHFWDANIKWVNKFLPNQILPESSFNSLKYGYQNMRPFWQKLLEAAFNNNFGLWLERKLADWQIKRIKQGDYIFAKEDELSFHPASKHEALLKDFFKL